MAVALSGALNPPLATRLGSLLGQGLRRFDRRLWRPDTKQATMRPLCATS
jgi:hypothetical protein